MFLINSHIVYLSSWAKSKDLLPWIMATLFNKRRDASTTLSMTQILRISPVIIYLFHFPEVMQTQHDTDTTFFISSLVASISLKSLCTLGTLWWINPFCLKIIYVPYALVLIHHRGFKSYISYCLIVNQINYQFVKLINLSPNSSLFPVKASWDR